MSGVNDYWQYDGLELARLVHGGEITAGELLEAAMTRMERLNPAYNILVARLYDRARSAIGAGLPVGPFTGVPFLLKDIQAMLAGVPTSAGSRFYRDWAPDENSEVVNRQIAAGLVIAGKTNTPEFGMLPSTEPVLFGPTKNPWDPTRTVGGSSGGAAAAVASRMGPVAGAADGGGSIRTPASCCGVFGLKPSRGRTPTGPQDAEVWHGFTVQHAVSVTVRDSAALLDATCGPLLGDTYGLPRPATPFLEETGTDPGRLNIAVCRNPFLPAKVHADVQLALEQTVGRLVALGHRCTDADPKLDQMLFARAFLVMVCSQTRAAVWTAEKRTGRTATREGFEPKTWLAHRFGELFSGADYVRAIGQLQSVAREFLLFSERYNAVLTPTLALPPQPLGFLRPHALQSALESIAGRLPLGKWLKTSSFVDEAASSAFAFAPWSPISNVTGQPSMSIPIAWSQEGLPLGMMLTGNPEDEATLLRLAGQLEQAHPWKDRIPPACRTDQR